MSLKWKETKNKIKCSCVWDLHQSSTCAGSIDKHTISNLEQDPNPCLLLHWIGPICIQQNSIWAGVWGISIERSLHARAHMRGGGGGVKGGFTHPFWSPGLFCCWYVCLITEVDQCTRIPLSHVWEIDSTFYLRKKTNECWNPPPPPHSPRLLSITACIQIVKHLPWKKSCVSTPLSLPQT